MSRVKLQAYTPEMADRKQLLGNVDLAAENRSQIRRVQSCSCARAHPDGLPHVFP